MRKKLLSMLVLLCLTVSGAWAQNPDWLIAGDVWDATTKTLTVKSNPGDWAYGTVSDIVNLVISDAVTSIGEWAFPGCESLTRVTIGNSVTSIGEGAFYQCPGLTSIEIPNSVTSIGGDAFGCCGLTSVTIGNSVTSIGNMAFGGCESLTSITIPNSVTSIGELAFCGCVGLTSVILNSNPTIGTDAFTEIADGAAVTMNLTANAAGGAYWMTFYNQNYDFEADANTKVFKAALTDTELELTELTTDKTVTKNNAVILKSTASPIVMTLTSTASSNDFSSNSLLGVPDAAGLTAADPSTTFVLNNGTGGVGFYRLKSGKTVGVGKAYLTYDAGGAAAARGYFLFDETTGIEMPTAEGNGDADAMVYDLQGRRVLNPTKGLYIVNGKKVFINK